MQTRSESPLSRYVQILEAVAAARTGLTLTEIGQQLDLRAPTVHRLAGSLKSLDLLANQDGSKSYVLGRRMQLLLHSTLSLADYSHLVTSILRELVGELGETVHLARLNGTIAESVLMVQPEGSNRAFVQPGRELPLHAAASGKAILAFQSPDFIERYLARPRTRFTENTKVSEKALRAELARVRADGIAVCDNELDAGVLSYGHPVRVKGGYVLYSIGVTGLADRFRVTPKDAVREKLSHAAALLSEDFGAGA
ncbi:MAG: IclR family transcriptional regulator [Burkholderiales bacterium]|nr:IclR family transcriptional regulator [Burkholderiales bacterium]